MSQENVEVVQAALEAWGRGGFDAPIRNGKIVRGREYWERAQSLEAAGLRE